MKRVSILGSTGSIGQETLNVIDHLPDHLQVTALAARSDIDLLEIQAKKYRPKLVAVREKERAKELKARLPDIEVVAGEEGIIAAATHTETDLVVSAIPGFEGVLPTFKAVQAHKQIALANKEALVVGGELLMSEVKAHQTTLIPIDSEHTAIFQCLKGENPKSGRRVILTASGGPFWKSSPSDLATIQVDEALSHPHYKMGAKVMVNSSTLMNKGLEMIEAHYLYHLPVEVVVHPEQLIHSMVEFIDGSILAQMGEPDMRLPIQVALTHPERHPGILAPFDFTKPHTLQFFPYEKNRFRCLDLAYESVRLGGSMPCFLNGANEVLVDRFLKREIGWTQIGEKLETLMEKWEGKTPSEYAELFAIDADAKRLAQRI